MRQLACLLVAALLVGPGLVQAQEPHAPKAGEKKVEHTDAPGKDVHAKEGVVNHDPEGTRPVMEVWAETAIWTIVIFVGLFFILQRTAWPQILEGMKKRESSIESAIEEAKLLRADNAKSQADLQKKLDEAYAEIPRLMDQARKDAESLREKMRSEAATEVQQDRTRLLREIDTAKDQALQEIWSQAAQLATLISTKVIGRSLTVEDHRRLVDEATADLREKTAKTASSGRAEPVGVGLTSHATTCFASDETSSLAACAARPCTNTEFPVTSDQQSAEFHGDVSAQRVAKTYAEALFAAAEKAGTVEQVRDEFLTLLEAFNLRPEFEHVLGGAAFGRDVRADILEKLFKDKASQTFYAFLQVLNGHERLELIRPVARALRDLADEKAKRVRVWVTSAAPLGEDQLANIRTVLEEKMALNPVMMPSVDPSLLGGMKVRVGDFQYDGSVKTRIDNLRNQILEKSSHEIQSGRDRFSS